MLFSQAFFQGVHYTCHVSFSSFSVSEAVTVGHQLSDVDNFDLPPLRSVISFGRSAKVDPKCNVSQCVYDWLLSFWSTLSVEPAADHTS